MSKRFFACAVDWQHELGEASDLEGKMPLYSDIEDLKRERSCWTSCGIVELELTLIGWPEPQKLWSEKK